MKYKIYFSCMMKERANPCVYVLPTIRMHFLILNSYISYPIVKPSDSGNSLRDTLEQKNGIV